MDLLAGGGAPGGGVSSPSPDEQCLHFGHSNLCWAVWDGTMGTRRKDAGTLDVQAETVRARTAGGNSRGLAEEAGMR